MDNKDTVEALNDLIKTSLDGEYGFRTAAEHAKAVELRFLLKSRAEECRTAVSQLQQLVAQCGGEAADSGSASGAMHRGWVAVKATLAGYTDLAILEECESGEDAALQRYRDAAAMDLPPHVRAVVEPQYEGVKRNHLQIRTLRDQARAAGGVQPH